MIFDPLWTLLIWPKICYDSLTPHNYTYQKSFQCNSTRFMSAKTQFDSHVISKLLAILCMSKSCCYCTSTVLFIRKLNTHFVCNEIGINWVAGRSKNTICCSRTRPSIECGNFARQILSKLSHNFDNRKYTCRDGSYIILFLFVMPKCFFVMYFVAFFCSFNLSLQFLLLFTLFALQ